MCIFSSNHHAVANARASVAPCSPTHMLLPKPRAERPVPDAEQATTSQTTRIPSRHR